jgi:hypothetical protein
MGIIAENELNIQHDFESKLKYVFISNYNENTKLFSYHFEPIDKNATCTYGSTNFKRIIAGKLTCTIKGKVYNFI